MQFKKENLKGKIKLKLNELGENLYSLFKPENQFWLVTSNQTGVLSSGSQL